MRKRVDSTFLLARKSANKPTVKKNVVKILQKSALKIYLDDRYLIA